MITVLEFSLGFFVSALTHADVFVTILVRVRTAPPCG